MCFSAEASFAGGTILSVLGVATLTKARKPSHRLFAAIPLVFGLQQFAEGVLWNTLKSGQQEQLQNTAAYIFLITALVIWPVMVPLSLRLLEETEKRKRILTGLVVIGSITSLFYGFCLIFYDVTPQIQSYHIQYVADFPATLVKFALAFYLVSTISPLFISSVKRMRLFGFLVTVSCIVTVIFYSQYLTSVWCFFAALISMVIYWILSGYKSEVTESIMETQTGQ